MTSHHTRLTRYRVSQSGRVLRRDAMKDADGRRASSQMQRPRHETTHVCVKGVSPDTPYKSMVHNVTGISSEYRS